MGILEKDAAGKSGPRAAAEPKAMTRPLPRILLLCALALTALDVSRPAATGRAARFDRPRCAPLLAIPVRAATAASAEFPGKVGQSAAGEAAGTRARKSAVDHHDAGAAQRRAGTLQTMARPAAGAAPGAAAALAATARALPPRTTAKRSPRWGRRCGQMPLERRRGAGADGGAR